MAVGKGKVLGKKVVSCRQDPRSQLDLGLDCSGSDCDFTVSIPIMLA